MKYAIIILLFAFLPAALVQAQNSSENSQSLFENPAVKASDNTAVNQRDKYLHEHTAQQQGKSKQDTRITQFIRKEIVRDKNLSTYAKNIKIITMNGEVTLKGPVRSADEVKTIVNKAQKIAGVSKVLNQMDIAAD